MPHDPKKKKDDRTGIPEGVLRLLTDEQIAMLKAPEQKARFDRCVADVQRDSPDLDAFAVCTVSVLGAAQRGLSSARLQTETSVLSRSLTNAVDFGGTINLTRVIEEHANGDVTVEHQVARAGDFVHAEFGEFTLDERKFRQWESNINRLADMGQDVAITIGHKNTDDAPAAGWIKGLKVVAGLPMASIRLLADTVDKIRRGEFRYWSPEFWDKARDEHGRNIGSELCGGAITNIPFLVGIPPFELSALGQRLYLSAHPRVGMIQLADHGRTLDGPPAPHGGDMPNDALMELLGVTTPEEILKKVTELKRLAEHPGDPPDETEEEKKRREEAAATKLAEDKEEEEEKVAAAKAKDANILTLSGKVDRQAAQILTLAKSQLELQEDSLGKEVVTLVTQSLSDGKKTLSDLGKKWESTPAGALAWLKQDPVYRGDVDALRVDLERSTRKVNLTRHLRSGVETGVPSLDDDTAEGEYMALADKIALDQKVPLTEAFALARKRNPDLARRYAEESTLDKV